MKAYTEIFGKCLNHKSGLRILIWPLEVPFFLVRKRSLLPKVTIFETKKMALRVAKFSVHQPFFALAASFCRWRPQKSADYQPISGLIARSWALIAVLHRFNFLPLDVIMMHQSLCAFRPSSRQ